MKTDLSTSGLRCLNPSHDDKRIGNARGKWEKRLALLEKIEAALARMDAGRYGLCTACDQRIPIGHLEADPTRAECPDCLN